MEPTCWMRNNNELAPQKNMEKKGMKEVAIKALMTINHDGLSNHHIKELCLPENGDNYVRFCMDDHNGKTEFYLLKLDAKKESFIEYVSGSTADLTPVGWKEITYDEVE